MADDHRPDDLYERDFYLWTQAQAEAIRAEAARSGSNAVDWAHVAEEIEDMGKSDFREICSRIETVLEHLFKLSWSQQQAPRASWRATIARERNAIELVLTASLRTKIAPTMAHRHLRAVRVAELSFGEDEPDIARDTSLRWTLEQVLGEENDPLG
jgi:hypothetical protein